MTTRLSEAIAPAFRTAHRDIKSHNHIHYWLAGGRGSTKSSFAGVEIVLGIMKYPGTNAVAVRKVKDTLKDSVFEQLCWAIEKLGVDHLWHKSISPLGLTYLPTGQKIKFRGLDDPKKLKSTKFAKGYCKYIWYEELDEFAGMEEIRNVNQSLMRGGDQFVVFYTYNPPQSVSSWVNTEAQLTRPDRLTHHSTYLDVPREWLGEQFILEAEHLRESKPEAYEHEYMGAVTGTGGEIFPNVTCRPITDEEISQFEVIRRGLDFGYAVDPLSYVVTSYSRKYKRLYIFFEIYKVGMSNKLAHDETQKENKNNEPFYADSAEPKSINEMRQYGSRIIPCKKGPDSVEYGIKFLQDLEEIIIDDTRCPETAREFLHYELEKDAQGNFKASYPDKNNHSIDAIRYALNYECMKYREHVQKKEPHYNFPSEKPKPSAMGGTVTESFFKGGWS